MSKMPQTLKDTNIIAEKTITQMKEWKILPTPENYALWYLYTSGENGALTDEIGRIADQKVQFTQEVNEYLHDKYIEGVISSVHNLQDSKEILSHVLSAITAFSGKTAAHNDRLGRQTTKLSEHIEKAGIKDLLGEVVEQLQDIHQSGREFNRKLKESEEEIKTLRENLYRVEAESRHDFLTGVYNRRALDEFLVQQTSHAERAIHDLSILMIDIDHFKAFNDRWGHQMGDEVLKVVGKAITNTVRGKDIVARYGGEEFSVLLPDTPISGARVVAENIRKSISASKLQRKDSSEDLGQITVSIGISRYRIGEGDTVPFLIKRADEALYAAKNTGRNKVVSEL